MSNLQRAGQRASNHPFFLAAKLAAYQQRHGLDDQQLADLLECSLDNLARLRLCRVPTTDREIAQVAARGQIDADKLAGLLRELLH